MPNASLKLKGGSAMLLIDYSLILGTGYVLYNFLNWKDEINLGNIIKQINSHFNNWAALQKSLGMEGYKLKKIKKSGHWIFSNY